MLVLDTNVLIYAAHSGSSRHEGTRTWIDAALASRERLGIPWVSALGFVRTTTSARVFPSPFTAGEALDRHLARFGVEVVVPG